MANGDITSIKELYRQSLGGGQNTVTGSKNNKILTVGEMVCTYVAAGISVDGAGGPGAFGVTNIDFIKIEPKIIASATGPSNDVLFHASYDHANNKIFMVENLGAADPAVPSDADTVTFRYICVGDDASAPELT